MNWLSFLGALGAGAVLVKLLDIVWVESRLRERERKIWLRDNRLRAYSALVRHLRSYGYAAKENMSLPETLAIMAEAELLSERVELHKEFGCVIEKLAALSSISESKSDFSNEDAEKLGCLTRDIDKLVVPLIGELRNELLRR
jgi:hypothetical protein